MPETCLGCNLAEVDITEVLNLPVALIRCLKYLQAGFHVKRVNNLPGGNVNKNLPSKLPLVTSKLILSATFEPFVGLLNFKTLNSLEFDSLFNQTCLGNVTGCIPACDRRSRGRRDW